MQHIGGKPKVSKTPKKKSSSSIKRNFTVVIGSKENGIYVSSSPSSAARKAVSKLCATDKKRKVSFYIREITQKSEKNTYGPYLGYIEKLVKPIELKGRVIRYKPVAKLSGKTGKKTTIKKGGMRGGEPSFANDILPCIKSKYWRNLSCDDLDRKMMMNNGQKIYVELLNFLDRDECHKFYESLPKNTPRATFTDREYLKYLDFYSNPVNKIWLGCQIYLFLGPAMKDIAHYDLRNDDAVHFFKWLTHKLPPEEEKIFVNDAPIIHPIHRLNKPEFYRPSNKNRASGLEFKAPPNENNNSNPKNP